MKIVKISGIIFISFFFINCSLIKQKTSQQRNVLTKTQSNQNNSKWEETMGVIIESVKTPDGNFAYSISYEITPFVNKGGKLNKGPIVQHIFCLDKKAIEGQKIKLQYLKEEPVFYRLLENIKYIN